MRLIELRQCWATRLLLITWFIQVTAFAVLAPHAHSADHAAAHTTEYSHTQLAPHHSTHPSKPSSPLPTQPTTAAPGALHDHAMSMASGGDSENCCADVEQCAFNHCLQAAVLPAAVIFSSITPSVVILDLGSAPVSRSTSLYRPPISA